jgi:hypothetical protein
MAANTDSKQFGAFGKDIISGAQTPGRVYHYIRAIGGPATVTFTSKSGTVFSSVQIETDDYDVYTDLVVEAGTVWGYLASPVD